MTNEYSYDLGSETVVFATNRELSGHEEYYLKNMVLSKKKSTTDIIRWLKKRNVSSVVRYDLNVQVN